MPQMDGRPAGRTDRSDLQLLRRERRLSELAALPVVSHLLTDGVSGEFSALGEHRTSIIWHSSGLADLHDVGYSGES